MEYIPHEIIVITGHLKALKKWKDTPKWLEKTAMGTLQGQK
jgi:hypothetical protein